MWYPIVRDIIFGLLTSGLVVLLLKQKSFLKEQIKILVDRQQALLSEASTVKTFTDRLLALFDALGPEKLVQHVQATEKLYEESAQAQIAEMERSHKRQVEAMLNERMTAEEKLNSLEQAVKAQSAELSEATINLALALYNLPRSTREGIIAGLRSRSVQSSANVALNAFEAKFGPPPADKGNLPPGERLKAAIQRSNPYRGLRPYASEAPPTDPTPGNSQHWTSER